MPTPILIAGPTASGKSRLALELAEAASGVVINADALQVYDLWRVLTARPSAEDEAAAEHALYGHVAATAEAPRYSVGRWLEQAVETLDAAEEAGRQAIIVGGTGLYFSALTRGLSVIPDIPSEIRLEAEARLATDGAEALAAALAARDPQTAAGLDQRNPRRVLRAWEVLEATGEGLAMWARRTPPPRLPIEAARALVLEPERPALHERIAARLDAMARAGALEEVAAAGLLGLDPAHPAMKAIGARAFAEHLSGAISFGAALEEAAAETRQYAKRQSTWFRNQTGHWPRARTFEQARAQLTA